MSRMSLASEVEKQLSELIMEKFPPGSKIPIEPELAEIFQVSRTTIRSAIKALCSRNVLEIRRGDGTYVTKKPGLGHDALGLDFLNLTTIAQEIQEVSDLIQPAAAGMAALRITETDISYLKSAIIALENGMDQYNEGSLSYEELRKIDTAFHASVIKTSHNRILDRLNDVLYSYTANLTEKENITIIQNSLKMHPIILEALITRDADKASAAMALHLNSIHLNFEY